MAIIPIPGQAVALDDSPLILKCAEKGPRCLAQIGDRFGVQVRLSPYDDHQLLPAINTESWNAGGTWTIDDGEGTATANGGGDLTVTNMLIPGQYYLVRVVVSAYTSGDLVVPGSSFEIEQGTNAAAGTFEWAFVAQETTFRLTAIGGVLEVENIELWLLSSPGLRVVDCTTETNVYQSCTYDPVDGVDYVELYNAGDLPPMAQISFPWNEMTTTAKCLTVCLVDRAQIAMEEGDCSSLLCAISTCCYDVGGCHASSILLQWTNEDNPRVGMGMLLNYIDFNYTQSLRVSGGIDEANWDIEAERYDFGSGGKAMTGTLVIEHLLMRVYGLTVLQHRAIAHGLGHDAFYVDGIQHFVDDSSYAPSWTRKSAIAPSEVGLVALYNQLTNSYCNQQPLPLADCTQCEGVPSGGAENLTLVGFYDTADTAITFGITAIGAGRYTGFTGVNLGSVTFEIDDGGGYVVRTLPFNLANGYTLRATRSTTGSIGRIEVTGRNY